MTIRPQHKSTIGEKRTNSQKKNIPGLLNNLFFFRFCLFQFQGRAVARVHGDHREGGEVFGGHVRQNEQRKSEKRQNSGSR